MLALLCTPLGLVPCRVALECSFGGAMSPRERKSLAHQIVRCYGHNRKAARPLDLHLSGLAEGAQHPDVLPANGHWQAWTDITLVQPTAEERWPDEVVWLTPDASEPLLELDPSAVYVIGGLIDRSVETLQGRVNTLEEELGEDAKYLWLFIQNVFTVFILVLHFD